STRKKVVAYIISTTTNWRAYDRSPKPQHLVLRAGYLLEPAPWTVKTHSWKIGFNTQQQAASRIIW
ncbi:hypothetical protein JYU34_015094, partial [Plutella xylostella]